MKNNSWLFPFPMPGDKFFDHNKDNRLTGIETIFRDAFWLDQQRKWGDEFESKYRNNIWLNQKRRFDNERGKNKGGYKPSGFAPPECSARDADINTCKKDDKQTEVLAEIIITDQSVDSQVKIRAEDYPNKRRYNAAKALAEDMFPDDCCKAACIFICENAGKITAADYLTYDGGFLYAQAIKDNFELRCSLPDEDEKPEMEFYEIFIKIAKRDAALAVKIWGWCLEVFGDYVEFDEYAANSLSQDVFYRIDSLPNRKTVTRQLVQHMEENPDFCKKVMSLSKEYCYGISEFIAAALLEKQYAAAETMFKSELYKVRDDWREILSLTKNVIDYCSDEKQLEATEYFRDNFFPVIRAIPDAMVQDEVPELEKTMEDYISRVEKNSKRYAYTRGNIWRAHVPDGKLYGLDPIDFSSEQEYMHALNQEKYSWREWCADKGKRFGLNVNDYETLEDFNKAICAKAAEAAEDKTVYTYCGVLLSGAESPYFYLTDDNSIKIGDTVIVPVGYSGKETEGTVVSVGQYLRVCVPFPVEKTKKIIRKKNG